MSVLNFTLSAGRKLLASAPAPSPTGYENTGLSSPYANKGSLESVLVVVLAAMICALICALGLISLLSCALRCSRRMPVDSSDEAIRLGNTGVKKAVMKGLPIIVYTSASKLPPGLTADCSICLAEFREEENLRVLPKCNHGFHVECIDKWLTSHSSCPMCRHSLNLVNRNEKPGGAAIAQATVSSCNAMHVAIETTDSTQTILSRSETLERSSQEATEVTASSPLPPSSVSENSCHAVNNVG